MNRLKALASYSRSRSALRLEQLEPRCMLSTVSLNASADTFLRSGQNNGDVAVLDSRFSFVPYIQFDMTGLNIDQITDATLTIHKVASARNDSINTARFAVYGLTNQVGNTPQNWSETTLIAGVNSGAEWIDDAGENGIDRSQLFSLDAEDGANVIETVTGGTDVPQELTGPDLVAFLNTRADDDGLATFVIPVEVSGGLGYGLASKENANVALHPTLELTFDDTDPDPDPDPDSYPKNPVVLPRQVEKLDRGVVAMRRSSSEVYVGWRLLGSDPADIAFNLYRSARGGPVKLNATPLTATTDFVDDTANLNAVNVYSVSPVINGVEQESSEFYTLEASSPIQQFLEVPIEAPSPTTTSDGGIWEYTANDASVGDLDGDGDYEIVLKWTGEITNPDPEVNYLFSETPNMYVDAYDMDGTMLWRIDVGPNLRTIASSLQFIVYDLDGDGRSEVAMNTADGTTSYTVSESNGQHAFTANDVIGDPDANWVDPSGWITTGPEYLAIFDGLTGDVLTYTNLEPARGNVTDWGDDYGHRSTTHNYSVAYLDGQRPSLVLGRGIYHGQPQYGTAKTEIVAWDFRSGQLSERWTFTATEGTGRDVNPDYVGQGNHQSSVADVDGDGFDEIIWGAMAVDHDGTGLYSTGRGHGDALHVADMDPDNPGLEIFSPHESPSEYGVAGGDYRNAMTGELITGIPGAGDIGRGAAFDIDPNYPGYEFWATAGDPPMIHNVQAGPIYQMPSNMHINFGVWWDADPLRETLDGTIISKWQYWQDNPGRTNLVWYGASGINNNSEVTSNNGTKRTPALTADLFGDWREEVIWRKGDNSALQVWSTTISSTMRIPTLMHDLQYREAVAWQNVYYNQPPHPSYFLGAGMDDPPLPPLFFGGELAGDYNADNVVDAIDYAVWRESLGSTDNLAADGSHNGVVDQEDYQIWLNNFGAVQSASPALEPLLAIASEELFDQPQATEQATEAITFALYAASLEEEEDDSPQPIMGSAVDGALTEDLLLYHISTSNHAHRAVSPAVEFDDDTDSVREATLRRRQPGERLSLHNVLGRQL